MKISRKALLLLIAPAMLAACSVRQLNDGSFTTCHVGNPCQVGPQAVAKTAVPAEHKHHHHHMMKKAAPAPAKTVAPKTDSK